MTTGTARDRRHENAEHAIRFWRKPEKSMPKRDVGSRLDEVDNILKAIGPASSSDL
jgi:hypothetical protein